MPTPLTIILSNEKISLGLLVNEITIHSAINSSMKFKVSCSAEVDDDNDDLLAKLDYLTDIDLNITGDYGNPTFKLELTDYNITYDPSSEVQIVELNLTDRYNKFRKLDRSGMYYHQNLHDIWLRLYSGFKDRLNSDIHTHTDFIKKDDEVKYPIHPIYMQYEENHIAFLERALLEHGANYNWFVSNDGFEQVLYNTNDHLNGFVEKGGVASELYNYTMTLNNNIKANKNIVIAWNIVPAKSGYILNSDLDRYHQCFIDDGDAQSPNKREFVKTINYIHHNPRTPEEYFISKAIPANTENPEEKAILCSNLGGKYGGNRDYKSKFNTLSQAQLDECLKTELNILISQDAEQLAALTNDVFLLAGAKLDISGDKRLKSSKHLVTASIVKLVASDSTDKVTGDTSKKDYNVTTTTLSQDVTVDYHQGVLKTPQITSFTGVFPYMAEDSSAHDGVDPNDIGSIRVTFPLDYEITPNDNSDRRAYIPRMSDYGDKTSSHGVQLYRESELHVFFIDGCVNKPIIHGALAHGGTSDLSMNQHHSRHMIDNGQGTSMGYTSATEATNSMFLKAEHKGEVSWINQSNHGMLDQLMATTTHRSEVSTGEYQSFHGFDEDTNFSANHHRSLKPKTVVEDVPKVKTETIAEIAPMVAPTTKIYRLSDEELKKLQDDIKNDEDA